MQLVVDEQYGDELIAANERTIKEDIGLKYNGLDVILDVKLGDGVLACNQRTHDGLQGVSVEAPKEVEEPVIVEPESVYTWEDLVELNKKEQVEILRSLGLGTWGIRKLKYESQRIEKIIELAEEE